MKISSNVAYYLALFKRELLQHNGALWVTPLVLLCLVQIGALFSGYLLITEVGPFTTITIEQEALNISRDLDSLINNEDFHFQPNYAFVSFAVVICLFYLLDSLYSDRKDRSILFWRSLPVSEYENVAVKLTTAVILIPGIFTIVGLISSTIAALILYASISISGVALEQAGKFMLYVSGLGAAFSFFISVGLFSLFMIPVHLFLLTVSALARRSPWLTLILPLLGITLFESMVFRDVKFVSVIGDYIVGSAQSSFALANGDAINISLLQVFVSVLISVALYFSCVMLRLKKFEI